MGQVQIALPDRLQIQMRGLNEASPNKEHIMLFANWLRNFPELQLRRKQPQPPAQRRDEGMESRLPHITVQLPGVAPCLFQPLRSDLD